MDFQGNEETMEKEARKDREKKVRKKKKKGILRRKEKDRKRRHNWREKKWLERETGMR